MLSSTQRSLEYTLTQEFQQRLKNFQRNAEIVRKHNAKHSKEPDKVCWLLLLKLSRVGHSSYEVIMSAPSGSHISVSRNSTVKRISSCEQLCFDNLHFLLQFLGLNNGADKGPWNEMKPGVPSGPYRGGIAEPYSKYKHTG